MSKQVSRRKFLQGLGLAAVGTAAAACQPKTVVVEKEVEKIVKETVVVEKEKVVEKEVEVTRMVTADEPSGELIFWGHDDHPHDLAATGFVEKYPQVKWESPHPADRGQKLRAAMAAGEGCPDLYWAESTEAQDFGCQGLLVELTEELAEEKDMYHPLKWNETFLAKTGHNIGWPGDISVSGWYYRADILEDLGYGDIDFDNWTYDDFSEMSTDLAGQGKFTFLFPAAGWYQGVLMQFRVHQVGGSFVSKDGQEITIGDEKGIEAMRIVKQMYNTGAGLDVDWLSPQYYAAMKDEELIGQFAAAWETGFWESNLTVEEGGLGRWRVAKLPGGDSIKYRTGIFGGAQLITPKCAQNTKNAIAFMRYSLGSLEGAALCGKWGIIPSYRSYLQSPLFLRDKTPLFGEWSHNEFWAAQEKELSLEYVRPAGWDAVNGAIAEVMPDIMEEAVTIEQGLEQIVEWATQDFERTKCVM
jgi:ABC-type glycerol-3-phosphate transport system substrate-binding protein